MQLYELEKRLTMDVKAIAKEHGIDMTNVYINVQTSRGAFGHFAPGKWIDGGNSKDELALNPEYFDTPLELLDTMIHELVHVYCHQNSIKDTSRNGNYHNVKFKKIAEQFGLHCEPSKKTGWNTTPKGNEQNLESVNSRLPYPITGDMVRKGDQKARAAERSKRKIHVYTCPECQAVIRSKELIMCYCKGCKEDFQLNGDDPDFDKWEEMMYPQTEFDIEDEYNQYNPGCATDLDHDEEEA